jgi:ubiquinone/menaquinone biosynthesis C-methylase UbiE
VYGEAEQISQTYAENSFDLVHAANSLDHSHDPVAAIKAAVRVVKPGGCVYLEHILNEGDRERYGGLHQWNFGVESNSFTITSKAGRATNMAEALAGAGRVTYEIQQGDLTVLLVTIRKI